MGKSSPWEQCAPSNSLRDSGSDMTMTTIKQLAAAWRQSTAFGLIVLFVCSPSFPQQNPTGYTFRSQTELVLVNVTARDSHGNLVRDLKQGDFTILEDNKTQQLSSF